MLSKKMAFSLTSLITIIALAFVVSPAMAAEFGVSMSIRPESNISSMDGNHVRSQNSVSVDIKFDKVISIDQGAKEGTDTTKFHLSDISVIAYNKFNGIEPSPTLYDLHVDGRADGQNFRFRVGSSRPDVTRVLLYLEKHEVEVADPRADLDDDGVRKVDGKNAVASLEIKYIAGDPGSPLVYSIRQVDDPLIPLSADTVDVIVLLSEMPMKFDKDFISVSDNAAVTTVTALRPLLVDRAAVNRLDAAYQESTDAIPRPMFMVPNYDTADGADEMILNPETSADTVRREGDTSPIITGDSPDADYGYDTDGYNYSIDEGSGEGSVDELRTAVTSAEAAADNAEPNLATASTLADYELDVLQHAALVEAHGKAVTAFNTARNALVQAQREEYWEDSDAYFDGLLGFYRDYAFNQVIARNNQLPATGPSEKLYPYAVTLTPNYKDDKDIVVRVKMFEDTRTPNSNHYYPPRTDAAYREGIDQLSVDVKAAKPKDKTDGIAVYIPEKTVIPADGYLVVAKNKGGSAVRNPGGSEKVPVITERQPFGLTYNLVEAGLVNLETLLINGGTIDIIGPGKLVISEIMWGSDASLDPDDANSQYIELRNTSGAAITVAKETYSLVFYGAGVALPDMSVAANNVQDRAGTIGTGGFWAARGQGGRTGVGEAPGDQVAVTPTQKIVSMQRVIDATGVADDGTLAASWAASVPPGVNFDATKEGTRVGSPGRAPTEYPIAPPVEPPVVTVPVAMPEDIVISEIMVSTGGGRLPQWIELTNISGAEVSLAGWSVAITNDAADKDVVGSSVSINLSGTLDVSAHAGNTGKGQSLLLVAWGARSSSSINADLVMNVSSQVGEAGRYTLISEMGFMVALVPPQTTGVLTYGDTAGNLDAAEAWEIPTAEGARSSLIRREMDKDSMATMGTSVNGWVMASATALVSGPVTWYGSDEDAGTPGYDAGGPLPVELSMFYPARDKITGAVVIKWETQSELNNAGFFIKRSQQRSTNFKVINAAMIQGAGTISEKQSYTYTDTTAQPNVVYYYQIEDVSLDGNRQLLTRGIRLRGHIGAAGKATVIWGDLKTSQ